MLPNRRFHRNQGIYAGLHFNPQGQPISAAEWQKQRDQWLPSAADTAYIQGLMHQVTEPGKIAGWIAPPTRGINGQPFEYEYVRL